MEETSRQLVERIYRAAVAGADPAESVRRALDPADLAGRRILVLGLGKAARRMTDAALETVADTDGSLVIDAGQGDHPVPGPRSFEAAQRLAAFLAQVKPGDHLLVLLSGGTSSLIGSPVEGIANAELTALFQLLLASGLDIHAMNLVRKRFCRWAAGRIAVEVPGAFVQVLAISDVAGDRVESIGSGPCTPDPSRGSEVTALLRRSHLLDRIPAALREYLARVEENRRPETPKPGDPAFDRVTHAIVANNNTALDAAAREASRLGLEVRSGAELSGDAVTAGHNVARAAAKLPASSCLILGGETTVTLTGGAGRGGRCQELALAAALELDQLGANDVTILAAGTDGRDGPTDAAGAIVDGKTAERIRAAGLDPSRHLIQHNTYPALDCADALLRPGDTNTNVRDVVVAVARDAHPPPARNPLPGSRSRPPA